MQCAADYRNEGRARCFDWRARRWAINRCKPRRMLQCWNGWRHWVRSIRASATGVSHLPRAEGIAELGTLLSAVAMCPAAGAAPATAQAHRQRPPEAAGTDRRQPGVVLRLRVRLVRQWPAAQVPDRHRRMDPGGPGDRGRWPDPLGPRHRGAVAADQRAWAPRYLRSTMARSSSPARS